MQQIKSEIVFVAKRNQLQKLCGNITLAAFRNRFLSLLVRKRTHAAYNIIMAAGTMTPANTAVFRIQAWYIASASNSRAPITAIIRPVVFRSSYGFCSIDQLAILFWMNEEILVIEYRIWIFAFRFLLSSNRY